MTNIQFTSIVGNVLFSGVLFTPGMLPADRPSHLYRKRKALDAGCSVIFTYTDFFLVSSMSVSENEVLTSANPGSVVWMTSTVMEYQLGADSKHSLFYLLTGCKVILYLVTMVSCKRIKILKHLFLIF
jgi:hypothetical protein